MIEGLGFDLVDLNLGLSGKESRQVQWRLGTAARSAADRADLRARFARR